MSTTYAAILPRDGDINVPLNSEVVFRIIKSDSPVSIATLGVTLITGLRHEVAIENGVFVNDFDGEFIDNSGGNFTDVTVVIIRPPSRPLFDQGQKVIVGVSIL